MASTALRGEVPEGSRRRQKVPESARRFRKAPEGSGALGWVGSRATVLGTNSLMLLGFF